MSFSKKIFLLATILVAVFAFGFSVKAISETEKQALIVQIQAKLNALYAELAKMQGSTPAQSQAPQTQNISTISSSATASCYTFFTNMNENNSGQEIAYLQKFLGKEGFVISNEEVQRSYFGVSTKLAVNSFQLKYKSEILTPAGLKNPTGKASYKTREKLNSLYGCNQQLTELQVAQENPTYVSPTNYTKNATPYSRIETSIPATPVVENTMVTLAQQPIDGLSLNGTINLKSTDGIIRVVLVDSDDKEYLVFEANVALYEIGKDIEIVNACRETCAFASSVKPIKVKVKTENATIAIKSLNPITPSSSNHGTAKYSMAFKTSNVTALSMVQATVKKNNLPWVAGETGVSGYTYAEKKRILNIPEDQDLPNLKGFEYYKSGIFSDTADSGEDAISYSATASATASSSVPDKLDYFRYMTEVKDQGPYGNCFAFATAGMMEAQINRYYNTQLDINLSEQQVVDCSAVYPAIAHNAEAIKMSANLNIYRSNPFGGANYAGGVMSGAGITDEYCDPYDHRDFRDANQSIVGSACDTQHICSDWATRIWKPFGAVNVSAANGDELRKAIAENGPGYMTIYNLAPLGLNNNGIGHAMIVMGYNKSQNYFIFKNSWGPYWGEGGYIRMRIKSASDIGPAMFYKGPFTPPTNSRYVPAIKKSCEFKQECESAGKSDKFTITDWNCQKTTTACDDPVNTWIDFKCNPDPSAANRVLCKCNSYWDCGEWSECVGGKQYRNCYKMGTECSDEPAEAPKKESKDCGQENNGDNADKGTGNGTNTNCTIENMCESKSAGCTPNYICNPGAYWFCKDKPENAGKLIPNLPCDDVNGCGMADTNSAGQKLNPRLFQTRNDIKCPGTSNGGGDKTTPTYACSKDSDCGTSGFTGQGVCVGKTIYQNYILNRCDYAGTPQAKCFNSTFSQVKQTCPVGCLNGACTGSSGGNGGGGGDTTNPICVPKACSALGFECGMQSDGCGNEISCGSCQYGTSCSNGKCDSCASICDGKDCGVYYCGGRSISCQMTNDNPLYNPANVYPGYCPTGYICSDAGKCISPQTVCQPGDCGYVAVGDGGVVSSVDCGSCPTETLCDSAGRCGLVGHYCGLRIPNKCPKEWYGLEHSGPTLDCTTCATPEQCAGLSCGQTGSTGGSGTGTSGTGGDPTGGTGDTGFPNVGPISGGGIGGMSCTYNPREICANGYSFIWDSNRCRSNKCFIDVPAFIGPNIPETLDPYVPSTSGGNWGPYYY